MMSIRGRLMGRKVGKDPEDSRRGGQGLVEFTLVLPILLILIFVFIEGARLLHAWLAIENGARFGIRFAVTGEYDMEACGGTCSNEDIARIESIKDAAETGASSVLYNLGIDTSDSANWEQAGAFKTTICPSPRDPSQPTKYVPSKASNPIRFAECTGGDDGGEPGDMISVTVDFNHPLITPFLSTWWPEIHLTSRREAVVESFRTTRTIGLPPDVPTLPATATYTATETKEATNTPTATASTTPEDPPHCLFSKTEQEIDGSTLRMRIRNNEPKWPLSLTYTSIKWESPDDVLFDSATFNGNKYWDPDPDLTDKYVHEYSLAEADWVSLGPSSTTWWIGNFPGGDIEAPDSEYYIVVSFKIKWSGGIMDCGSVPMYFSFLPTATTGPSPTASLTPTWGPSQTPTETEEIIATDTPTLTATSEKTDTPTPTSTPSTPTPTVDLGEL